MRHLKKSIDHIRREKEVSAADMAQTVLLQSLKIKYKVYNPSCS